MAALRRTSGHAQSGTFTRRSCSSLQSLRREHLGYRHRRFDIAFDIENLLNGSFRSAQFDTVSRLRTDPALGTRVPGNFCGKGSYVANQRTRNPNTSVPFAGCEGVDYTPAYPLTARLLATIYLD